MNERDFSRNRRLPLEITLAVLINMVRPGKRDGYQKVIDRFYSDTQLAFQNEESQKPPDKSAFFRARKKIPFTIMEDLFEKTVTFARQLAEKNSSLLWKGFRVFGIDGTKKNLPDNPQLRDCFEASRRRQLPPDAHLCIIRRHCQGPAQCHQGALLDLGTNDGPRTYQGSSSGRSAAVGSGLSVL